MKCKDLMTANVITAYKTTPIREICDLMTKHNIGIIPIVYEDTDFIAGVITDRDIITRVISGGMSLNGKVENAMTREVISIYDEEDVSMALTKMADHKIKRVLVTNNHNQLDGIISLQDVVLHNDTNKYINDLLVEVCMPNPQVYKPQAYLKAEDFPL